MGSTSASSRRQSVRCLPRFAAKVAIK
jgi:hypothetical protein